MSKGKKQKTAGADKANCSFRKAIENTPDVQHGYREGLQAIVKADKRAVMVKDARRLDGSLNIDEETKMLYPNESRWDYAVGYDGKVYYVEVHPANTSNIEEMIKKKVWLVNWLKEKAPSLNALKAGSPKFQWAATESAVHISSQSMYARRLSQQGIEKPKRPVVLG